MRKIYLIFAAILFASGFIACSDDDGTGEIEMKIEEVRFTARGGETELKPKVSGSYDVVADQDWIKAWVEDGVIKLQVPSFVSGVNRKGSIEIKTKSSVQKVSILQLRDILRVIGKKEVSSSINEEVEYKVAVENTFENSSSRITLRLKDEKDSNWLKAAFTSDTEITVNKLAIPSKTPKKAVVYLVVEGDVETTVMDSLMLNASFAEKDFINTKWNASFVNHKSKAFNQKVEIIADEEGSLFLDGLSAYEDHKLPVKIPMSYKSWTQKVVVELSNQYSGPLLTESDNREIYVLGANKKLEPWEVTDENMPSEYVAEMIVEDGKVILDFSNFVYAPSWLGGLSYNMNGFMFRAYNNEGMDEYYETILEPIETTRYLLDFKLTLVSE